VPTFERKITLGDLLALLLIVVGVVGYAVRLEGRVTFIDDNGTKAVRSLTQEINALRIEMVELRATIKERERREKEKF
jgi:hypothetical protein